MFAHQHTSGASELKHICSAGSTSTNMVGDLPGYGTVWYYADGIANILSLYRVAERFHVSYNIQQDNAFVF